MYRKRPLNARPSVVIARIKNKKKKPYLREPESPRSNEVPTGIRERAAFAVDLSKVKRIRSKIVTRSRDGPVDHGFIDGSAASSSLYQLYSVFTMFCGDRGLATVSSSRGPTAAISGTAKQQSQSSVLASLTRMILSYGLRTPSHGPPGRRRFM